LTRRALALMDAHREFVRATVVQTVGSVPGKLGATLLMTSEGTCYGTVGGASLEEKVKEHARAALGQRAGELLHFDLQAWKTGGLPSLCGGSVDIALEYVPAHPHILLWGGGHVAEALGRILPTLEYDFSVADDRPDWVGEERFPSADRRQAVPPERLWESFEPTEYTHLYVLGYDATKDTEVIARSLDRFPNAIGFIASAAKRTHMRAELRRRGYAEAALARIRSPIGLPIGAESPAEIAVSVAAELVQGMHGAEPAEARPSSPSPELAPKEADARSI
ncbi:MAG: XdhC family protein, partial [Thermoplasmata archaeon]